MAKGTGTQRSGTRQQTPSPLRPPRTPQPPPSNIQGIRLFIGSLAVTSGTIALSESGMHGWPLLIASSAFTFFAALLAILFERISQWYPKLELPRRLRVLGQPRAYFVLFCVVVSTGWFFDLYTKLTSAHLGSFYIYK